MKYLEIVEVYEELSKTGGRLQKMVILAEFLKRLKREGKSEWIYLILGRVVPDYDSGEIGISTQLALKAIAHSFGVRSEDVIKRFKKIGDLGEIAEEFAEKKRQSTLSTKTLSIDRVFNDLKKIISIEGKGAVDKKMDLISGMLGCASPKESKYIVRTLISDLRIGVSSPTIVDAIALAFFGDKKDEMKEKVLDAYDLANDFAVVFDAASKGLAELEKINVEPGRPLNVMLAVKVSNIDEAFEVCGKPAAVEQKYDGFRVLLNKTKEGKILLFTRRLENVTSQFPDVVEAVKKNIKGESFILDSEIVGFDSKTGKYLPFESISQRIKRKYDIEALVKKLPVEINVFDVLFYNGKNLMGDSFINRRKIVEKIVREKERVIRPAVQIITDREKEAMKFYENSLKIGEEGVMVKKLDAPYKQGRRVGYMVKLKPLMNDFDLVIVGAEYGTGKRGGWLTSYILACRDEGDGNKLVEVGKVSSGLKEKEEEGMTYYEMTKILKPLVVEEGENFVRVKPSIVVSVNYQNVQESPSYDSGFALRFPRITNYRPDRRIDDIATLDDIRKTAKNAKR